MIQFQTEQLTVFQSVLYQTTSAVIQTNEAVILTDPNWLPNEVAAIKQYINDLLGDRKLYIIYTHSDFDHIIAAGAFPQAVTIASEKFVNRLGKDKVLEEIQQFDAQYYVNRDYPIIYPDIDVVITEDGQTLRLGDMTITFYLAPGHTEDGLFTIVEPNGIFLAGDYLSDVEFPFISDLDAYVATLDKARKIIKEHNVHTLVPGHGMTTNHAQEIIARITQSQNYLADLQAGIDQDETLQKQYPFYKALKELHEANRALIKK